MATLDPPVAVDPADDATDCELLGPTALVVQGLMGVFVIASLVVKRQLERRKRRWKIWTWDVGKQLVGQAVVHALNLLISALVANASDNNPCSLYFLNVLIDTTLGVVIFYFALRAFTWLCTVRLGLEGYVSGQYGHPPQAIFWWRQLIPYLASFVTMKLLVLLPLTLPGISGLLIGFGHALLEYLSPSVQVIFAMALFPLVMNILQFCLVDQVIKGRDTTESIDEDEELGGGYERLLGGEIQPPVNRSLPGTPREAQGGSSSERNDALRRMSRSSAPSPSWGDVEAAPADLPSPVLTSRAGGEGREVTQRNLISTTGTSRISGDRKLESLALGHLHA